jgi:hypothetical protein
MKTRKVAWIKISIWLMLALLVSTIFLLLSQHKVKADSYDWISGTISGQQRDDLSTNPDDYGTYGKCANETVQLAGVLSPTEVCVFQAKSFRYSIYSGRLYIRIGEDQKLYPVNNVGFASNTHVTPSPNTNDFIFGSIVVKDLPSKITFNSQSAGSYDPSEDFSHIISLDEQDNSYTISSRSVSLNGEWEVINVQNIGLVRIHLTDLSVTRFTSYQNLNKFSAVSDNGRFVAVTSFDGSDPLIYDLESCGQSATILQSSWSNTTVSNPCPSRNLTGPINDVFNGSGFVANTKPEFNDDGWQLTMFAGNGTIAKGVTLSASGYTPPQTNLDSDNDGLSDYIESRSYPNRQVVFCGTSCVYPDPATKDVFIEVDWMKEGGLFGQTFKPTDTMIAYVQSAFEDKGVNIHFDTGQDGGGNELPTYVEALRFVPTENETDFFNLKNGDNTHQNNFAEERRGIWHYMITGNKLYDGSSNTTSGVSYAGDDDTFVALGQVASAHPSTQDQAIAGTIIHELGHNLCLSNDTYTGQDPSCVFSGIDTYASNDYHSSMNYSKQFSLIDYSEGTSGQDDHDDWSAVLVGMDDFVTLGVDPQEPTLRARSSFDKTPIYN